MAHQFLSDGWFDAVEALGPPPARPGPFDGPVNMVVARSGGDVVEIHFKGGTVNRGLLADAPTTVTTTSEVVRALFVRSDQHAAMHAFMAGHVEVQGDLSKLMAMGTVVPTPEHRDYARSIDQLTDASESDLRR